MKSVAYNRVQQFSVNGGKTWFTSSVLNRFRYGEIKEDITSVDFPNFESLVEFIEEGLLENSDIKKSLFTKEKYVNLRGGISYSFKVNKRYFEKHDIQVRIVRIERPDLSFSALKSLLTADEFCSFLKDRGIKSLDF